MRTPLIGTIGGAVVGGLLGSTIGGGRGSDIAAAVAPSRVRRPARRQGTNSTRLTGSARIKKENGESIVVVQKASPTFCAWRPGPHDPGTGTINVAVVN